MAKQEKVKDMTYEPRRMDNENCDWLNYVYSTKLTSKAKLVASVLASYMHGGDEAFPGLGRLVHETSLSRRSVQNAVDELTEEGWIVKKPGGIAKNGSLSPNHYQRKWKFGMRPAKNFVSNTGQSTDPIAPDAIGVAPDAPPVAPSTIPYGNECHTLVHQLPTNKKENKKDNKRVVNKFTPPSQQEVEDYLLEKKYTFEQASDWAEDFVDFYASKDWMVGKNKMKSWPHAASRWAKQNKGKDNGHQSKQGNQQADPLNDWAQW